MKTLLEEITDNVYGAIEDVMDQYENRQFLSDGAHWQDGLLTKIIEFEIDGQKFRITIQ